MRQKLLCSLLLLLGADGVWAQSMPMYNWNYQPGPAAYAPNPYYRAPSYYPTPWAPGYVPMPANYAAYYGQAYPNYTSNYTANYGGVPNVYPGYGAGGGNPGFTPGFPAVPGMEAAPEGALPAATEDGMTAAAPGLEEGIVPPPAEAMEGADAAPAGDEALAGPEPGADGLMADGFDVDNPYAKPPVIPLSVHRPCCPRCCWGEIKYMAAWIRPGPLSAPLITAGSPAAAVPGALGQPGTIPLFGSNGVHYGMFSGLRGEGGFWLDPDNRFSTEVSGFILFPNRSNYRVVSDAAGNPAIFRPVINAANGQEAAYIVSAPGLATGSSSVDTRAIVFGAEWNIRYHNYWWKRWHAQTLGGFRFLELNERLSVTDSLTPAAAGFFTYNGNPIGPNDMLMDNDTFRTINRFYGFQVGEQVGWNWNRISLDGFAKVALGLTDERVNISGQSTLVSPGSTQTTPGGILALASNSGNHQKYLFGVVPEFGFNLGVDITRNLRFTTGYSFLLWSSVARPGAQIDRNVNPALVPTDATFGTVAGSARPAFAFSGDVFWINNFMFGLEYRY